MNSAADALRVFVVADDLLARTGLGALLASQPVCSVVGQVGRETGLSDMIEVYRPDVLVWDFGWDPTPHLEHLAELEEAHPPVVALIPTEPAPPASGDSCSENQTLPDW